MKNKKAITKKHASGYIAAVFADSLRSAGFVCPDDDLLCWYRRRSDEVVNSIIFRSLWSQLPLFLEIRYGIIPSFAMPVRIKSVVNNDYPDEELFVNAPLAENYPNGGTMARFSLDAQVYAPLQDGRGLYTFEKLILPEMDRIQTIQEAYNFHKNRRINHPMAKNCPPEQQFYELSKTFIDMALWVDDSDMYEYAAARISQQNGLWEALSIKFPQRQIYAQELIEWKRLQKVFENKERDSYIAELTQRANRNAQLLNAKYLI